MVSRILPVALVLLGACNAAKPPVSPPAETRTLLSVADATNANVTLASDGRSVVAAWAVTATAGTNIFIARSDDGGASFSAPRRVNNVDGDANVNGEAPPRIALAGQSVQVVWMSKRDGVSSLRSADSADGGVTFTATRRITPDGVTGARGWENVALSPDGVVHAVWLDGRNAGAHAESGHGQHGAMRQDILHATWKGGSAVTESPIAANVCFCCKTALLARTDGVIAAWRHIFPGGIRDIAVARSNDGGRTFGEPVRVSADNWQIDACPDDGPAIAMDAAGTLHVVWPTMVDNGGRKAMGIFHATSSDGGRTFSARARVDGGEGSASHPVVTLDAAGRAAVAWDEALDGARRVRMRVGDGAPVTVSEGRIASYPSIAVSGGAVIVGWTDQSNGNSVIRLRRMS